MSSKLVVSEVYEPGVSLITLNRPEKRNALNSELMQQLCAAVHQVESDEQQRVLLIRGAGKVFCAGLDLAEAAGTEDVQQSAELVGQTLVSLYETRLITIAAVHGAAIAGGAGLMSACDFVIADEDTKIGYPEVKRGLVASFVMGLLCTQVPRRVASELLLLGEIIDARRALAIGLVNRTCQSGAALQEACQTARQLLRCGPHALAQTKRSLNERDAANFSESISQALVGHLSARDSDEAREGLAAFLEKRPPSWNPPPPPK